MKTVVLPVVSACLLLALTGCETTPSSPTTSYTPAAADAALPDSTPEGLIRVKGGQADLVYVLPGADLSTYTEVSLAEPEIEFVKNWQWDYNSKVSFENQISSSDMVTMVNTGKRLLKESFTKQLTKGGYTVVDAPGPKVLLVKATLADLDVYSPDPNLRSSGLNRTYTQGAGEATMMVELHDSVTGQLLARAYDRKSGKAGFASGTSGSRDHATNMADASAALDYWAGLLVNGLNRVKTAHLPAPAAKP
jgi:Protein of unknown function (DUF3313)